MKTILIVEDQKDMRQLLCTTLGQNSRRFLHAGNADEGLVMTREEQPDLVLLDIMMPGDMDGMDLLHEIRRDNTLSRTRVVIMSALTQQSDKEKALGAGADEYLCKPFRLEVLHEIVNRYCND